MGVANLYEYFVYFHHYGYNQKAWGHDTDIFTNKYQFWFTNAINNMDQQTLKELKKKLREEIRKAIK